jgi:hypothetical protein
VRDLERVERAEPRSPDKCRVIGIAVVDPDAIDKEKRLVRVGPRRKSEVAAPAWPVANSGAPAALPMASAKVASCWRSTSEAVMTVIAVPTVVSGSGSRVAVVTTGSNWIGVYWARAPGRAAKARVKGSNRNGSRTGLMI